MRISYSSIPMGGDDDSTATMQAIQSLLHLVDDVARISATGFYGRFKKDCTDLSRRVALLSYLVEEIWDFQADHGALHFASSSSSFSSSISQLTEALTAANMLLQSAGTFDHDTFPKIAALEITSEFQSVTCKLDKALACFPFGDFEISEDVKEQVDLVRGQLKRATHRHGVESKVIKKTSDAVEEEKKTHGDPSSLSTCEIISLCKHICMFVALNIFSFVHFFTLTNSNSYYK